ncbi:MAG TPA: outer membrane lipoprotein carrier protein LolA [Candidatus Polarisedimenticolia bacterium]|nr:outer membrane lipoprotein carrier protein LolA [Candidatus Polarisedimenticolia bacterium]
MAGHARWMGMAIGCAALTLGAAAPSTTELAQVLAAFDAAQQRTTSIVAEFTEEKNISLLAKPVVARGVFTFQRPNHVRWEYRDPETRLYVITEQQYVAYIPSQKKAEEVPISRFLGKRLFRFIGLGQSIADLETLYDFRLEPESDLPGTHLLVLTPHKKRVQDKVAEIRIWVDRTNSLPRRFRYLEADGDSTTLTFRDSKANVEVAAGSFDVTIPSGVAVTNTFNGFALGGGAF